MKRVNVGESECPISQSVERVGDWWSLLLVLDAFLGFTRFEQFQENLRISAGDADPASQDAGQGRRAGAPQIQRPPAALRICADRLGTRTPAAARRPLHLGERRVRTRRAEYVAHRSQRSHDPPPTRSTPTPANRSPPRTPSSPPVPPPVHRSATTSTTPPNFSAARAKKGEMRGNRLLLKVSGCSVRRWPAMPPHPPLTSPRRSSNYRLP